MLTELALKFRDFINKSTRTEAWCHGAVILVRRGNGKKVAEFKDGIGSLIRPGSDEIPGV